MKFAVVADAHVGFGASDKVLERAIEAINLRNLEFAVFLGDMIDSSCGDEPEVLLDRFLKISGHLRIPKRFVVGNHDLAPDFPERREAFREEFLRKTGARSTYYSFDAGIYHFAVLDTLEVLRGAVGATGRLSGAQLEWLKSDLARLCPDTPVVILSHHPPFPADQFRIENFNEFLEALEGYHGPFPHSCRIVAVVSGHRHFRETHVVDGIRFEVVGPLSFGLWDMKEVGYTVVELAGTEARFTWNPLAPSPEAP